MTLRVSGLSHQPLQSQVVRFRANEKLCYRGSRFFAGWLRIERQAYLRRPSAVSFGGRRSAPGAIADISCEATTWIVISRTRWRL